jgi:hypothetical protein
MISTSQNPPLPETDIRFQDMLHDVKPEQDFVLLDGHWFALPPLHDSQLEALAGQNSMSSNFSEKDLNEIKEKAARVRNEIQNLKTEN